MQEYFSDTQLAQRYSVSRSTIWRWADGQTFPKPIQLSPGTTRWRRQDIERYDAEAAKKSA